MLFNYIVQNVVTLLCITKMLYVHVMKSKVFIGGRRGGGGRGGWGERVGDSARSF